MAEPLVTTLANLMEFAAINGLAAPLPTSEYWKLPEESTSTYVSLLAVYVLDVALALFTLAPRTYAMPREILLVRLADEAGCKPVSTYSAKFS